jgi:hypothetical protein
MAVVIMTLAALFLIALGAVLNFAPTEVAGMLGFTGMPVAGVALQVLAGALLALGVTYAAAALGPRLSGLFAMFPVMSTVLVGFSHRANGPGFAVALLRGMVDGYYAFAVFCLALSLLLGAQPVGTAFLLATGAALAVQLGVKWGMRRRCAPQRASAREAA